MKKKMSIVSTVICILTVGLSPLSLLAEDFSFMGITWNDDLSTVRDKIRESGFASDTRWMVLERESVPLNSIIKNPIIDEEKSRELTHMADELKKDSRIQHQLKYIQFRAKRESMIKNAIFFFVYDRDVLLAYEISLDVSNKKVTELEGEEYYQDLVKKYGAPTRMLEYSRVWSARDQSLYYTPINDTIIVTYISKSNLSSYVDRLGGKPKKLEPKDLEKRPGEIQVTY